ncbi:Calx-beta domain-containing protein [Candidatus Poriferisocius sp.]|uniref:Calx-beta domain-containing protein n=1 Tax=Candidatus Poriferisocius sp. TaxID=3101276 RepID=UPI003B52F381
MEVNLDGDAAAGTEIPVRMRTTGFPTASAGDFTLSNEGVAVIGSDKRTATLTFTAVNDTVSEDDEFLILEFGTLPADDNAGIISGTPDSVRITITDDDAGVTVTETGGSTQVPEDGSATDSYTLKFDTAPASNVTVQVTAPAGVEITNRASDRFWASQVDLVFATLGLIPTAETIRVRGVDDEVDNPGDKRTVTLTHAITVGDGGDYTTSAKIADVDVIVTDDDTAGVTITESPTPAGTSVPEDGSETDSYTVVLDTEPLADVTVTVTSGAADVATVNKSGGTAGGSQTLTFTSSDWNNPQTVTVAGVDDDVDNPGDKRTVSIAHAVTVGDGSKYTSAMPIDDVAVTVTDDDAAPTDVTLSAAPPSVAEGDGTTTVTVTATVDGNILFGTAQTVAVTVASSGVANAVDVTAAPSTFNIVIPAGGASASAAFALTPTDDGTDEADETVTVSGTLSGVTVEPGTVTVTDDDAPVASFASATSSAAEDAGTVNVVLNLRPSPHEDITVKYVIGSSAGRAEPGEDYTELSGTVDVSAGATSVNIPIAIIDDDVEEFSEGVVLALISGDGYSTVNTPIGAHTLTITDNEGQPVSVSMTATDGDADGNAVEAASDTTGYRTITITLDRALTGDESVTVPLRVRGATVSSDFTFGLAPATQTGVSLATSGSHSAQNPAVVFTAGALSATLRLTPVDNTRRTQPYVVIEYGAGNRAPSAVSATTVAAATGGPFGVVLIDDETGDITVSTGWALAPSGLLAGDDFRLLFRTTAATDATSTDIDVYDEFVRSVIAKSGHGAIKPYAGFFKVFASTRSGSGTTGTTARVHNAMTIEHNGHNPTWADGSGTDSDAAGVPTYWLGGARLANNYRDLCDQFWAGTGTGVRDGFDRNDPRSQNGARNVPTGSISDFRPYEPWTGSGNACEAWNHPLGSSTPSRGGADSGGNLWHAAPAAKTQQRPLYGYSPVFRTIPTVGFERGRYNVLENTNLSPRLVMSSPVSKPSTFTVTATAGSATPGADFTAGPFTVTVPANVTKHRFDIAIPADKLIEGYETFSLTISDPPSGVAVGQLSSADVQITNVTVVSGNWHFTPKGLSAGDQFRLLFKTDNTRRANSENIGDFDTFVRNRIRGASTGHAAIREYAPTFRVVVSTRTVAAAWHTATGIMENTNQPSHTPWSTPIYWLGGDKLADDHNDFWDGTWDANEAADHRNAKGVVSTRTEGANTGTLTGTTHATAGVQAPHGEVVTRFGDGFKVTQSAVRHGGVGKTSNPINHDLRPAADRNPYLGLSGVFELSDPGDNAVEFDRVEYNVLEETDLEKSNLEVTLLLDAAPTSPQTFTVTTTAGTATSGADFEAGPFTVTVPANETAGTFEIEIEPDNVIEDYETFTISIGTLPAGFTAGNNSTATVQITNVTEVPGTWALAPPGLKDGDQFRLMFKTSNERDATSADIADYDSFVRASVSGASTGHAAIRDYAPTFRVVGSTETVGAAWHTATGIMENTNQPSHTPWSTPIYWLGGLKVADSHNDFWDGTWAANQANHHRNANGVQSTNTKAAATGTSTGTTHLRAGVRSGTQYLGTGGQTVRAGAVGQAKNAISAVAVPKGDDNAFLGLSGVFKLSGDSANIVQFSVPFDTPYINVFETSELSRKAALSCQPGDDSCEKVDLSLTLELAVAPTKDETFTVTTTAGTATSGADFEAGPFTVTVPAGETAETFKIEIPFDAEIEDYETFTVAITPPEGFVVGVNDRLTIRIVDTTLVSPEWTLAPDGLEAGDRFRLLFATKDKTAATSADINTYRTFIRNDLATVGHEAIKPYRNSFEVIGSTVTVDAHAITATSHSLGLDEGEDDPITTWDTPIYWLGGDKLADDHEDFWDGNWDAQLIEHARHADGEAYEGSNRHHTGTCAQDLRPGSSSNRLYLFSRDWVHAGFYAGEACLDHEALGNHLRGAVLRGGFFDTVAPGQEPLGYSIGSRDTKIEMLGISAVFEISEGEIFFEDAESTAAENTGTHNVMVKLDPAPTKDTMVSYAISGTAVSASDYRALGEVEVSAGSGTVEIPITIIDDETNEVSETVVLALRGGEDYGVGDFNVHAVEIIDDDPPTFTVTSAGPVVEGPGASATFTVTADRDPVGVDVTLNISESGQFVALSEEGDRTLTFAAAQRTSTYSVPITNDVNAEPAGVVTATLKPGAGYRVGDPAAATAAVSDDDTGSTDMSVSVERSSAATVNEGTGSTPGEKIAFVVTLGRALAAGERVDVGLVVSGTGVTASNFAASSDFAALAPTAGEGLNTGVSVQDAGSLTPTVTFEGEGAQVATLELEPIDEVLETPRREVVTVAVAGAATLNADTDTNVSETLVVDSSAGDFTVTVLDDEYEAKFTQSVYTVNEGDGTATVTVELSRALDRDERVALAFVDQTATESADYELGNDFTDPVTVPAGERRATLVFPIIDDAVVESTETLQVIAKPQHLPAGTVRDSATVRILDDDPTVSVTAASVEVFEGTGAVFEVTRNTVTSSALVVNVTVAESGSTDYVAVGDEGSRQVTIPANETSFELRVPTVDSSGIGTVTVTVEAPSSAGDYFVAQGDGGSAVVEVADDDTAGVTVRPVTLRVLEADDAATAGRDDRATYEVRLNSEPDSGVTVTVTPTSGDSAALSVSPASLEFTMSNWSVPQTVTVTGDADTVENPGQKRTVEVTHTVSGTGNYASVTSVPSVSVDVVDLPPVLSIASPGVVEGDSGTTDLVFTVTLTPASLRTVTVEYLRWDALSTTVPGVDHEAVTPGTLTFAPGETTKTITVKVFGDVVVEPDENLVLYLRDPTVAVLNPDAGPSIGDIRNDDTSAPPVLSIAGSSTAEGDSGTSDLVFTVTLTPAAARTVTVDYSSGAVKLTPAQAAAGRRGATDSVDYEAFVAGTLSFAAGETSKTVTVKVKGDVDVEPDELVVVELSDPVHAVIDAAGQKANGVITNDDGMLRLSTTTATIHEVDDSATPSVRENQVTFTVALSEAPQSGSVEVAVTGEFPVVTVSPKKLVFTASDWSDAQTVTVSALNNNVDNSDERTGTVRLVASAVGTSFDGAAAEVVVTVTDDDAPPVLSVDAPTVAEGDSGTTDLVFTVTLDSPSGRTVTVDYADTGTGTATSGANADYKAVEAGTVTFKPYDTAESVTVTVNGDTTAEPDETVVLSFSNPAKATLAGGGESLTATGTIVDDEAAVQVSAVRTSGATVNEGTSGDAYEDENGVWVDPAHGAIAFEVRLSRVLGSGERIDVPLVVSGTGVTVDDFEDLVLADGDSLNTGVSITDVDTLTPVVVFDGAGAKTATLMLEAFDDVLETPRNETVTIAVADDTVLAARTGTTVDAVVRSATAHSFDTTVVDDEYLLTFTGSDRVRVPEGAGTVSLDLGLSHAVHRDVRVRFRYIDNPAQLAGPKDLFGSPARATSGTDYTPAHGFGAEAVIEAGDDTMTLTFDIADDSADESTERLRIEARPENLPAGYLYDVADVYIVDNDPAGDKVVASAASVAVTEGGAAGTYTLKLTSDPVQDVTVTVTVPQAHRDAVTVTAPGGTAGATAELTFTTSGTGIWSTAQTVTVNAIADSDTTDETVELAHTASVLNTDNPYHQITIDPVTVNVTDHTIAPAVVVTSGSVSVREDDTVTYSVQLASDPGGTVVVTPTSGDTAKASVSGALTFTSSDWGASQQVTVTGVAVGATTITHAVTTSTTDYPTSLMVPSVSVRVVSADVPEVSFGSSGGVSVVETDGVVARLGVVLSEPLRSSESLKVAYSVSGTARVGTEANKAGADAVVSPSALLVVEGYVLSSSQPGAVSRGEIVVSLIDDVWVEGAETVVVTLLPSPGYTLGEHTSRTVQITNDDTAPEVLLSVDTDKVSEGDGATRVRVRAELSNESRYESDVVVSVSVDGSGVEGAVGFAAVDDFDVTITAGAGSASARFTLTPTANEVDQPDEVVSVSASVVPAGLVVSPASLSIELADDDAPPPAVVRFGGGGFAAEGDASSSATVNVQLGRVLGADESLRVPLAITGAGVEAGDVMVVDGGSAGVSVEGGNTLAPVVVFTGSDTQGVTVDEAELTVTAGDDDDGVHEVATFGLAAGAADQPGGGVVVGPVGGVVSGSASVQLVDDDATAAAVLAWPGTVSVTEGGGDAASAEVQVRLSEQPSGGVVMSVLSWDGLAVRVSPASLTFSTSDWDEPQSVTVTAVDDLDTDAESVLVVFTAAGHTGASAGVSVADGVSKASALADAVFAAVPGDLSLEENDKGPVNVGSPVTATDADGDTVTYSLEGPSQAPPPAGFKIDSATGQISYGPIPHRFGGTTPAPGFDRETSPQVALVVVATSIGSDGTATAVRQPVSVTVTDVDEGDGTVVIAGVPVAGRSTLTASLSGDPDGDPAAASYVWEVSADGSTGWTAATGAGADTASYSVTAADAGKYLRVTVDYTDGGGNSESVEWEAVDPVGTLSLLNAAVEVTSALGSDADHTSDTAAIKVSLDSLVLAGETVTVPLAFTGGTLDTDFTLAESGTGVSLDVSSVVFTGPAASTATVRVSATSAAVLANVLSVAPGAVAVTGASLADTALKADLVGDGVVFTGASTDPGPGPGPGLVLVLVLILRPIRWRWCWPAPTAARSQRTRRRPLRRVRRRSR